MTRAGRYLNLCSGTGRANTIDCAYKAAFYLLSYDVQLYDLALSFVNEDGIAFEEMKKVYLEDTQKQYILDIAHNLFSYYSDCKATPFEISRLGYPWIEQVCTALYIASGAYEVVICVDDNSGAYYLTIDDTMWKRQKSTYEFFEKLNC